MTSLTVSRIRKDSFLCGKITYKESTYQISFLLVVPEREIKMQLYI